MDPRSQCPACKVVIDGNDAVGAADGFRATLTISPAHWNAMPKPRRLAIAREIRGYVVDAFRYVHQFAGIREIAPAVDHEDGLLAEADTLRVYLAQLRGLIVTLGEYALANPETVGDHPLYPEVGQWECDVCDRIRHISREVAGLPQPY